MVIVISSLYFDFQNRILANKLILKAIYVIYIEKLKSEISSLVYFKNLDGNMLPINSNKLLFDVLSIFRNKDISQIYCKMFASR